MTEEGVKQALLTLISEKTQERLRLEQRVEKTQRAIADLDSTIQAIRITLNEYCDAEGIPRVNAAEANPDLAAGFLGKSAKEMLQHWSDTHHGEIVMRDASHFLVAAGMFGDERQAASTLYSTVRRMSEFAKISRGVFRDKRAAATSTALRVPGEESETAQPTDDAIPDIDPEDEPITGADFEYLINDVRPTRPQATPVLTVVPRAG